jgi:hypothetical protein
VQNWRAFAGWTEENSLEGLQQRSRAAPARPCTEFGNTKDSKLIKRCD